MFEFLALGFRRFTAIATLSFVSLVITACGGLDAGKEPSELEEGSSISQKEQEYFHSLSLWEKVKPKSFSYTRWTDGSTACRIASVNGRTTMTSLKGLVVMPVIEPEDAEGGRCYWSDYGFDNIFSVIERYVFNPPEGSTINVKYDEEYGYPVEVNINSGLFDKAQYRFSDFETGTNDWGHYYAAKRSWLLNKPFSYSLSNLNGQFNVAVKNSAIESVWSRKLNRNLTAIEIDAEYLSIDSLFIHIESALKAGMALSIESSHDEIQVDESQGAEQLKRDYQNARLKWEETRPKAFTYSAWVFGEQPCLLVYGDGSYSSYVTQSMALAPEVFEGANRASCNTQTHNVEAVFDLIEQALEASDISNLSLSKRPKVSYDTDYGHPTDVSVNGVRYIFNDFKVKSLSERERFNLAKRKWLEAPVPDYGYTLERHGWSEWNGEFYVKTRDLAVQRVVVPELGGWRGIALDKINSSESDKVIFTIDELFDEIDRALNNGFTVNADYDDFRGYPFEIQISKVDALTGDVATQGRYGVSGFHVRGGHYLRDSMKDLQYRERYYDVLNREFSHYKALWDNKKPNVFSYSGRFGRSICRMSYDGIFSLDSGKCNPLNNAMDNKFARARGYLRGVFSADNFEMAFDREYGYPSYASFDQNTYWVLDFEPSIDIWNPYYTAWNNWLKAKLKLNVRTFTLIRQGLDELSGQFMVKAKNGVTALTRSDTVIESVWSDSLGRNLTKAELAEGVFSMEGLFEEVWAALRAGYIVDVEYDEKYSFPVRIKIDKNNDVSNDDITINVTDFNDFSGSNL